MKQTALLATTLLALALSACGGSSSSSSSSSSTTSTSTASSSTAPASTTTAAAGGSGATVDVAMKNLAFAPASIQAKVGDTVKWTNNDSPPHNVTYQSGPKFTSSSTMNPGATFTLKLTKPGTIHYFCSIHPFMKATIVVAK